MKLELKSPNYFLMNLLNTIKNNCVWNLHQRCALHLVLTLPELV